MTKIIKRAVKSIIGNYNVFVLKDSINRTLNTKAHAEKIRFQKKAVKFYSNIVKENELCFDVGANFGNRIRAFVDIKAKVVAVEPQKDCCKYLSKNFGNDIILVNKALGAAEDKKTMFISDITEISSLSEDWIKAVKQERYKDLNWSKREIVEVTTLDNLIKRYGTPVFIKIDVEGYELEVLKGLSAPVKMISFEYTVPEQTKKAIDCIELIKNISGEVECNYSVCEELDFKMNSWLSSNEMIKFIQTKDFSDTQVGDIYLRHKV
jgi:FkbM family methyltransferase